MNFAQKLQLFVEYRIFSPETKKQCSLNGYSGEYLTFFSTMRRKFQLVGLPVSSLTRSTQRVEWRSFERKQTPSDWLIIIHESSLKLCGLKLNKCKLSNLAIVEVSKLNTSSKPCVCFFVAICTQCRKRLEKDSEPEPTPVFTERIQEIYPSVVRTFYFVVYMNSRENHLSQLTFSIENR